MRTFILSGARTPFGRLGGSLATVAATQLGASAIREALARGGIAPNHVDYVIMGHVLQAGQGQITARQAACAAGVPMSVPATTVNKVCLSGLHAVHLADLMVRSGEADIVVAGGMESMSGAPYLVSGARSGLRYGPSLLADSIQVDGLNCAWENMLMGEAADRDARQAAISRTEQDEVAERSHRRAHQNRERLHDEIIPVTTCASRDGVVVVSDDEGVRPATSREALGRLHPAFRSDGTVTAGNASPLSDGAAAVVVVSEATAAKSGQRPLAEIVAYGQVAGPGTSLLAQPSGAVMAAAGRAGLRVGDLEVLELNEAFACVIIGSCRQLGVAAEAVNPNGGAIALGHPIGASGARLALTLAYELFNRPASVGAAALCGGGGQGDALVLRHVA